MRIKTFCDFPPKKGVSNFKKEYRFRNCVVDTNLLEEIKRFFFEHCGVVCSFVSGNTD